jgi:hexosaminidase
MLAGIIPRTRGRPVPAEGAFHCSGELGLDRGGFEGWCFTAFEGRLKKKGISLTEDALVEGALAGGAPGETGKPALRVLRDKALDEEGYTLEARPGGVTLKAAGGRGVVQGLTTLYESFAGHDVPCFTLEDKPLYRHRGLNLDCARHFFDTPELERILEEMALVKLNALHWHLSDDQAWRIESRVHPKLNRASGPFYTQDEIRHIAAFARERGIEVIPEIEMPGHATGILAAYPELSCRGEPVELGKGGGIYPVILCAGKEEVYDFLFPLLDEAAGLFDSPVFHLGGDEAPKGEWERCPHCRGAMAKNGLADLEDLQGWFITRLAERLGARGKTVRCWNDILKAGTLPENLDIQYWVDWDQSGAMDAFLEKGGQAVFSDLFSLYFDYPEGFIPLEKVYRYEPAVRGRSLAGAPGLRGMEACVWTERIAAPEGLERAIFPRLFALAEAAWSGGGDYGNFEGRLGGKLAGLAERGVAFTALEACNPQGDARLEGIRRWFSSQGAAPEDGKMPDPEQLTRIRAMFARGFNLPGELFSGR